MKSLCVALALIGIAAGIAMWRHSAGLRDASSVSQNKHVVSPPDVSKRPILHPISAEALAFDLDYRLQIEQHATDGSGGKMESAYVQRGQLVARVLAENTEVQFVGFQMVDAACFMNGHPLPEMGSLFRLPVVAVVARDGRMLELLAPRDLPPTDNARLIDFYRLFQLAAQPSGADADVSWTRNEKDEMGAYSATYSAQPDGEILKKKVAYTSLAEAYSDAADGFSITVDASRFTGRPGSKGHWLEHFVGEEHRTVLQHDHPRVGMQVKVDLNKRPMPPGLDLWILGQHGDVETMLMALMHYDTGRTASTLAALEQDRLEALRKRYAGISPETITAAIKGAVEAGDEHTATIPSIHALRDYLLAYPKEADAVVAQLLAADYDNRVAGRILQALALAGHAEAQAALGRAMSSPDLPPFHRAQAIVSVGDVSEPNDDLLNTLWELSRVPEDESRTPMVASTSLLALGAVADEDRKADRVARADASVSRLRAELENATGDREVIVLLALANAAVPPDEAVYARLDHHRERVRAAAVRNLAAGETAADRERLTQALRADTAAEVRTAALESLVVRADDEVVEIVAGSLGEEPSPDLRIRQVVYLAGHIERPQSVEALERQLKVESVPEVRKSIHRALVGQQEVEF